MISWFCFICIKNNKIHTNKQKEETYSIRVLIKQIIQTQKKNRERNNYKAAVDDGVEGVLSLFRVDGK